MLSGICYSIKRPSDLVLYDEFIQFVNVLENKSNKKIVEYIFNDGSSITIEYTSFFDRIIDREGSDLIEKTFKQVYKKHKGE